MAAMAFSSSFTWHRGDSQQGLSRDELFFDVRTQLSLQRHDAANLENTRGLDWMTLARFDARAISERIAGMDDNAITNGESRCNLCFRACLIADPDRCASGAFVGDSIYRPLFAFSEQSAR